MLDEVTLLKRWGDIRCRTSRGGFALSFHSLTFASPWGRGRFLPKQLTLHVL